MFTTYNVLPIQKIYMKCFKRAKDSLAASTIIYYPNEVEMDEKMEKDKISVKTVDNLVDKSLGLFDCPPLKNAKADKTLKQGKEK